MREEDDAFYLGYLFFLNSQVFCPRLVTVLLDRNGVGLGEQVFHQAGAEKEIGFFCQTAIDVNVCGSGLCFDKKTAGFDYQLLVALRGPVDAVALRIQDQRWRRQQKQNNERKKEDCPVT